MQNYEIDQILAVSWDKQLASDLAAELESFTGERRTTVEEIRRFLAIKAYRDLLDRLRRAREGKSSFAALKSVALEMRQYALERPGLSAAAFRVPATECPEWYIAYTEIHEFMIALFAECGLNGSDADDASHILRSIVRGFVLHQVMNCFLHLYSYSKSYETAHRHFYCRSADGYGFECGSSPCCK